MLKSIRFRHLLGAIAVFFGIAALAFAADFVWYPHPSGACALETANWATVTDGTTSSCFDGNPGGLLWSSSYNGRTGYNALYAQAVTGCSDLVEGGFSDWRLPTIREIQAAAGHDAIHHVSVSYDSWNIPTQTWTTFTARAIWAKDAKGNNGNFVNLDDGSVVPVSIKNKPSCDARCVRP